MTPDVEGLMGRLTRLRTHLIENPAMCCGETLRILVNEDVPELLVEAARLRSQLRRPEDESPSDDDQDDEWLARQW